MDIKRFIFRKSIRNDLWKIINTLYWLIYKNNDVIVINSWVNQRWNKVLPNNWGDDLNFYLIKEITGKKVVNYRDTLLPHFNVNNYMCIGSIIEQQTTSNTIIWGSGAIFGGNTPIKNNPIKVCAVRGPKTQDYLVHQGIKCPHIYGDPALLVSHYFPIKIKKKYELGIIPHYTDLDCEEISKIKEEYKNDILIINLKQYNNWQDILYQINQCKVIASSSLHGLIISDSYKIPNVWIKFSNNIAGGDFKFNDYFMSVNRTIEKPLDFTIKDSFSFSKIINYAKHYQCINYNIYTLLNSCPLPLQKK